MSTTAKVKVTLEIEARSNWGDDCTVGQVRDQAIVDAKGALIRLLKDSKENIKIIGEMDVDVITTST